MTQLGLGLSRCSCAQAGADVAKVTIIEYAVYLAYRPALINQGFMRNSILHRGRLASVLIHMLLARKRRPKRFDSGEGAPRNHIELSKLLLAPSAVERRRIDFQSCRAR